MTTRNTTFTVLLMMSSIAAAVAAPEVPGHHSSVACTETVLLTVPAVAVVDRPDRLAAGTVNETGSYSNREPAAACASDVTEPYRRMHHGSFKLDPTCRASAAT